MKNASSARRQHVSDEILRKAGELFDERGYRECSLQDIADAVGIARPSLYHYFESKEEILGSLVERAVAVREQTVARIRELDADPLERLRTLIREVGGSTSADPVGLRLLLGAAEALPSALRRRANRSRRALFELLSDVLAEGMDRGLFRASNERETAATLIAALTGLQYRDIGGVPMEPEHAARQLEEVLVRGIQQQPARGDSFARTLANLREELTALERQARRLGIEV